jgi:hypothetical protein
MNLIKKLIFLFLIIFLFSAYVSSKHNAEKFNFSFSSNKSMQVGEKLTYVVKYAFFSLGEVTLIVKDKKKAAGETLYNAIAYIDSYENIPFISIHEIYKTKLTGHYYSSFFEGIVKKDEYDSFTDYYFNYDSSKIHVIKGKVFPKQIWTDSTTSIKRKYQDGLSIFYYARMNSGQKKSERIPGFVDEKKVVTDINFYNDVSDISIDAVDYPVACVKVDGKLNFVSIYGLTGNFEGWFTDDDAAVPVLAKMKVMVGSVTLELKEWKREGWKPPEYLEK